MLAVGALDRHPAQPARGHRSGQHAGGRLDQLGPVGEGQQTLPAAFDVEHQFTVDQHHDRPGLPPRTVPAAFGPGEGGTVGVGRIAGGQQQGVVLVGLTVGLCVALVLAQPVDRPGHRELGRAETLDEVAAPTLTALLQGAERTVGGAETPFATFGEHTAPGQHAVPVELAEQLAGEPFPLRGLTRDHPRPPAGRRR